MLALAIIATILCFLSFIGSSINRAKVNVNEFESMGDLIFSVFMCFLNRSFIITVIWILYSNIK